MAARIPNFFVVGAARSGTTSLSRYLAEHPQVYMSPVKEPGYFARDVISGWRLRDENPRDSCVLDWEGYQNLFRGVTGEAAIGEASTVYLISPAAPGEIRAAVPHARIIIMLRSPIERSLSTYLMLRRNGRLRATFSDVLRSETGCLAEWRRMILETRKVAGGVGRFLRTFPGPQVRWYLHEAFSSDSLEVMQSIYSFLGVDPRFRPDVGRRYNRAILPRAPVLSPAVRKAGLTTLAGRLVPSTARSLLRRAFYSDGSRLPLQAADRALLADYFREDVTELSHLLARDLSPWLEPD